MRGDLEQASAHHEEALALHRALGDEIRTVISLQNVAGAALLSGDLGRAEALLEEALAIARAIGDKRGGFGVLASLGDLALSQGDTVRAVSLFREAVALSEHTEQHTVPSLLDGVAALGTAAVQAEQAARLFGAAEGRRETLGAAVPPPERESLERRWAAARDALGETGFADAWAAGRTLAWEDAVVEATQVLAELGGAPS
jgi:tetratricopeptide (TPR) repeat protein